MPVEPPQQGKGGAGPATVGCRKLIGDMAMSHMYAWAWVDTETCLSNCVVPAWHLDAGI